MKLKSFLGVAVVLAGVAAPISYAPAAAAPEDIAVYFSPKGGCTEAVVQQVEAARFTLDVLAYNFTSLPIAKAVREAHDRGVKVRVVLDRTNKGAKYSSATYLFNAGVPVWIDTKHAIAHNKVMLIDGRTVITGSFNFTAGAEEKNAENLLVIKNHPQLFAEYAENFRLLLTQAVPYTGLNKAAEPKVDAEGN